MVVGLVVVGLVYDWAWLLKIAVVLGIVGAFVNPIAKWIDFGWMKLAYVLSLIVPNILLSAVFFLFLFPIALLAKLSRGKDTLQLRRPKDTVWITRDQRPDKSSFEKTW